MEPCVGGCGVGARVSTPRVRVRQDAETTLPLVELSLNSSSFLEGGVEPGFVQNGRRCDDRTNSVEREMFSRKPKKTKALAKPTFGPPPKK